MRRKVAYHTLVLLLLSHKVLTQETDNVITEDGEFYDMLAGGLFDSIPSESPSEPPSGFCVVGTTMKCAESSSGIDCATINRPNGQCSDGEDVQSARFQVKLATCDNSRNTQEGFQSDKCKDFAPFPAAGSDPWFISCVDELSGKVLFNSNSVNNGDTITLFDSIGFLPDECTCSIKNSSGLLYQELTINTSGNMDFYLKDTYGSFELEACDAQDCKTTVEYTYTTTNTGSGVAEITKFERARTQDGMQSDIKNLLQGATTVTPGNAVTRSESEEIDICIDASYATTINVDAIPPDGRPCPANEAYFFETNVRCRVDVEIGCESQDGIPCAQLTPPEGTCTDGDNLTILRWKYTGSSCDDSDNSNTQGDKSSCLDLGPLPSGDVRVTCTGNNGEILVNDVTVNPNDGVLLMIDDNGLPDTCTCSIKLSNGAVLQELVIDISGSVDLQLTDEFGSLQLEACKDTSGDGEDCLSTIAYTYDLRNVGTNDMDVTSLTRTRDGVTAELLEKLIGGVKTLSPGEGTSAMETEQINLCFPDKYCTSTTALADPPKAGMCSDSDEFCFEINPTCDFFTELTCTTAGGNECSSLEGEQTPECNCGTCASELTYRYTGNRCPVSLGGCNDFGAGPSDTAQVVIRGGGTLLFSGSATKGTDIIVSRNGQCIPSELEATIASPAGGQSLQSVVFDSCTNGELLDDFGALQFSGYKCLGDSTEHNCYEDVTYDIIAVNSGTVDASISAWTFVVNSETLLSLSSPVELEPKADFALSQPFEVALCQPGEYRATSQLNAAGSNGQECPYEIMSKISIGIGTPFPSPSPSEMPSPSPSASPSGFCVVNTFLECSDSNGIECGSIEPPNGRCSDGTDIQTARFRIKFASCDESRNTQEGFDENCSDALPLPSQGSNTVVIVNCEDKNSGAVLYSNSVRDGETIVLFDTGSGSLPDECTCSITTGSGLHQIVTINTSGDVDLYLKDSYGSFELESCDAQDCITNVDYSYTTSNSGSGDAIITKYERTRTQDGVVADASDLLTSPVVITPGNSFTSTENEGIDICMDAQYTTTVNVEATPPDGLPCPANAEYSFESTVRCRVDVEILCEDANGVECKEVVPVQGTCSVGDELTVLRFKYTGNTCEESKNTNQQGDLATCENFFDIPGSDISLSCIGVGGILTINNYKVGPGGTVTMTRPIGLPEQITCYVRDDSGRLYQQFSFDASGNVDLHLKDEFGGLQLEACTDISGASEDCLSTITYTYELKNVGTNDMDITRLALIRDGNTEELLQQLVPGDTTLSPGEETSILDNEVIDLCVENVYSTTTIAEADPPKDDMCSDIDEYFFNIVPNCDTFLDLTCTTNNGGNCEDLEGEQTPDCNCGVCAGEVIYRYTGNLCDSRLSDCNDFSTGPTSSAIVTITGGGSTLFSGSVNEGTDIVLTGSGPCIPEQLDMTVSTASGVTTLQTVKIDSSCSGSVLLDDFGAVQFAGYTCAGETNPHNCYTEVSYEISVINSGTVDVTLTEWKYGVNMQTLLSLPSAIALSPQEEFFQSNSLEVELCKQGIYRATSNVLGKGSNGVECPDDEDIEIRITTGTPFPSPSPSEMPSPAPSPAPSPMPSPSPSAQPSPSPSASPTAMPSGVCVIKTVMTCTDPSGVDCGSIEEPDGECSAGNDVENARFRLEFCACQESRNTQDGFQVNCKDIGSLPSSGSGTLVNVGCINTLTGALLTSTNNLGEGDSYVISGILPDEITCTISRTTGSLLQEVTINTSGNTDLYLKDKFGSLELEACNSQDCMMTVDYSYTISNTGSGNGVITKFERTRTTSDGSEIVQNLILGTTTVLPGGTLVRSESEEIDICIDESYKTDVQVDATPPDGLPCPAQTNYFFETTVRCRVDVNVMCESQDGVMCENLQPPDGTCSDGDKLTQLRFKYTGCTCNESENTNKQGSVAQCLDKNPFPTGPVFITCLGNNGIILVNSQMVEIGNDILLIDMGGLPNLALCSIDDGIGNVYQQLSFDISGTVDLQLKDKFGALELGSCVDTFGNGEDCFTILCFLYELTNVGTNDMDITILTRNRNNVVVELLDQIPNSDRTLSPGESTSLIEKEPVDLCVPETYTTRLIGEADPPKDDMCLDDDELIFRIVPTCDLFLELTCVTLDGSDCSNLQGEQQPECKCSTCAREVRYRYTADQCGFGSTNCNDFGVGPTINADLTIIGDGIELFNGIINKNTEIVLSRSGACIPDKLDVAVRASFGGPLLQSLEIDSTCSGATLLDNYGALDFTGYSCQGDQEPHNCFTEVSYDVTAVNTGTVDVTVSEWNFEVNSEVLLSLPSAFDLLPKDEVELSQAYEVNLCTAGVYTAKSNVNGQGENGKPCPYDLQSTFFIASGTKFPSPAPSEMPSPSPSNSPTEVPSPSPSVSPTINPSAMPTAENCTFGFDIDCIPPAGSTSCDATPPPVQQCAGRPTEMGFLYNGGFCNESFNIQGSLFTCEDLELGPTVEGEQVYIVGTDDSGSDLYFEGYVGLGEVFYLSDGGNQFSANSLFTIYTNETKSVIIQDLAYHSSCSSNLFLKDRFGAVQLVEWVNDDQGTVSCFASQTFELDITIPIDIDGFASSGAAVTMTGLTVASNVEPYFFNLTDQVNGEIIQIGGTFQAAISIPIDLTTRTRYDLLITVTAELPGGRVCFATELNSFTAGYPLPPIFPTLAPTVSPTGTDSPTPNPNDTPCTIQADIECRTFAGRGCVSITSPTELTCDTNGNFLPQSLDFRYTGDGLTNSPSEVHILVIGGRKSNVIVFTGIVQLGRGLRFSTGFDGNMDVTVSTVVNGFQNSPITNFQIDPSCDGRLQLLDAFGPLQLIGFSTREQGQQTAIELITLNYNVRNTGKLPANAISSTKQSSFTGGPTELISNAIRLESGDEIILDSEFQTFDISTNAGRIFTFTMDVTGLPTTNSLGCFDDTEYSFQT